MVGSEWASWGGGSVAWGRVWGCWVGSRGEVGVATWVFQYEATGKLGWDAAVGCEGGMAVGGAWVAG